MGPVKSVTAILIGIVYVFVLIIVISLGVIGVNIKRQEEAIAQNANTIQKNRVTTNTKLFSAGNKRGEVTFRNILFKEYFTNKESDLETTEFIKEGQDETNWTELVTLFRYPLAKGTLEEVDFLAENVKNSIIKMGGVVIDGFTVAEDRDNPVNFLMYSVRNVRNSSVEIVYQKFYIKENKLFSDAYTVNFRNTVSRSSSDQAIDHIGNEAKEIASSLLKADIRVEY